MYTLQSKEKTERHYFLPLIAYRKNNSLLLVKYFLSKISHFYNHNNDEGIFSYIMTMSLKCFISIR